MVQVRASRRVRKYGRAEPMLPKGTIVLEDEVKTPTEQRMEERGEDQKLSRFRSKVKAGHRKTRKEQKKDLKEALKQERNNLRQSESELREAKLGCESNIRAAKAQVESDKRDIRDVKVQLRGL